MRARTVLAIEALQKRRAGPVSDVCGSEEREVSSQTLARCTRPSRRKLRDGFKATDPPRVTFTARAHSVEFPCSHILAPPRPPARNPTRVDLGQSSLGESLDLYRSSTGADREGVRWSL